jgi:predicted Zn-dependent protease
VLGPAAAAVFLHEAVAHTLEVDTLALSGRPEAALGHRLGSPQLEVLDDPAAAPEGLSRRCDDEGRPVQRRWLLRGGAVAQLLADSRWAASSPGLEPGAARRSSRHTPPAPRSSFLQLLPGTTSFSELCSLAGDGLYLPEAERGRLDPLSGAFSLRFSHGRRIRAGSLAETVGACTLRGRVADLLAEAVVGKEVALAGAGWCAKGGQKLPVWAEAPPLLLDGVEISP